MKLALLLLPVLAFGADLDAKRKTLEEESLGQLLTVRRVFVDHLTGGETAAHIHDMIISSLQGARLFVLTENQERADAILKGAAEDLVFTDTFQSSEGINAHVNASTNSTTGAYGSRSSTANRRGASGGVSIGENESTRIAERKHEAIATVRLVNKDGDVIWSTTQESIGAKFRGASSDVADKIMHQLVDDFERAAKAKK